MDCGVGWKLGSRGRGVVVPGMGGDGVLDLGGGYGMQGCGWITYECLEKGTVGPHRLVTWAQLTLGLRVTSG